MADLTKVSGRTIAIMDEVQFAKKVAAFEQGIKDDIAEILANQTDKVKTLIAEEFDKQRKAIVSAYLPSLQEPDNIKFMVQASDGVMRERDTPQEAILLNGRGHKMQMVIEWNGISQ